MSVFLFSIYSDPAVHALQFLDVINMKDPTQKAHFYRNTLREVLPFIPRVSDFLYVVNPLILIITINISIYSNVYIYMIHRVHI